MDGEARILTLFVSEHGESLDNPQTQGGSQHEDQEQGADSDTDASATGAQ